MELHFYFAGHDQGLYNEEREIFINTELKKDESRTQAIESIKNSGFKIGENQIPRISRVLFSRIHHKIKDAQDQVNRIEQQLALHDY